MKALNRKNAPSKQYRERIIQFGEGNFLRAFADWIVWNMNEKLGFDSSVVVVQPIEKGMVDVLNSQDGLYHLVLKGIDRGEPVYSTQLIDVISRGINPYKQFDEFLKLAENPDMRFVISNTTEAGIAFNSFYRIDDRPAATYPGKLVQLLYHRYKTFKGAADKGLIIFPCELIFENGRMLRECIGKYIKHWHLGKKFENWVDTACGIYSTLVDRIVPGYPHETADEIKAKTGFDDKLIDEGEIFHLWVIEAPESVALEFPADRAGLNVMFVQSEVPYHERKVTLLNGPHTALSPVGYLSGLNTVRECVEDKTVGAFVRRVMFEELLPTLNLPESELASFANDVLDRFRNPYVNHLVTSIMLNSFSKYKTRDLPALKTYHKQKGVLPECLTLGLAAIIYYYRGGKRGDDEIVLQDNESVVMLLANIWKICQTTAKVAENVLAALCLWDENLNKIEGLTAKVTAYLDEIEQNGMRKTVEKLIGE